MEKKEEECPIQRRNVCLEKNSTVSFSERTWLEPKGWEAPRVESEMQLKLERQAKSSSMGLPSLMEVLQEVSQEQGQNQI